MSILFALLSPPARPSRRARLGHVLRSARTSTCPCGHDRTAHEHLRAGSDCCRCACARFRRLPVQAALRG